MVSPMREKRAWPPLERDSDGETVAAFEAAVAVVKETVVRSGEVLVSAKEDLSDHQRWLKAQTAAVQADRERHERWLLRQRERQEALKRRDEKRAKRRALRQAFIRSIAEAILGAINSVRSAALGLVAKIVGALNALDDLVIGAMRSVGHALRSGALAVTGAIRDSLSLAGKTARNVSGAAGSAVLTAGGAASVRLRTRAPALVNFLAVLFGGLATRSRDVSRALAPGLGQFFALAKAKIAAVINTAGEALGPVSRAVVEKAYAVAPAFWAAAGRATVSAGELARQAKARLQASLPLSRVARAEAENALSWHNRARGFELSQMLVIAGTILLVCGALMLGGGLILRAKTPPALIAESSPSEPIAWLFEQKDFPLDERSIFDFSVTPEGVRIKGFSIGAVNMSDAPISSLDGVIKPDRHSEELRLSLVVERPGEGGEAAQAAPPVFIPADSIPAQAPFKLLFPFPGAEGTSGMTPDDARKESSGILLKIHYVIDGKQRSFIHYLPLALLEEQLAEIQAAASGS